MAEQCYIRINTTLNDLHPDCTPHQGTAAE